MKACTFLPAATHIVYELGLEDYLYGVTFECPSDRPKVVRSVLEGHDLGSDEIEEVVAAFAREGKSLYYIDIDLLREISPDVIFTQHVCEVCQIDTSVVEEALGALEHRPEVVPLVPRRLEDIYENIITVAEALGRRDRGTKLVRALRQRINVITRSLQSRAAQKRRVMVMEWLDPIYNCGHWIPDQINRAGGVDKLSNPGGYSLQTEWEEILSYDPEVIVVAPCGFSVGRTREEVRRLTGRSGWSDLAAVENGDVYLADADLFTRPSPSVVDGIELLASLFHPDLFDAPAHLRSSFAAIGQIVCS